MADSSIPRGDLKACTDGIEARLWQAAALQRCSSSFPDCSNVMVGSRKRRPNNVSDGAGLFGSRHSDRGVTQALSFIAMGGE